MRIIILLFKEIICSIGHNYVIMEIPNFIAMLVLGGGDLSQVMA